MEPIVLAGPNKNALGTALLEDLRDRLIAAGDAPILLTGQGDAFSAGLDLTEVSSLDGPSMTRFLDLLEDVVGRLYHHRGPTVAWVNGHAIAGGAVLALCCDRRLGVDSPRARIGLNEVALGLRFPPRTLEVMLRQVPAPHHHEVLLGAGLFSPLEALRVGLLDAIGTRDQAEAWIAGLATHPAAAYAATKAALRPDTTPSPASRQAFLDDVVPTWTSPELKARLAAALRR